MPRDASNERWKSCSIPRDNSDHAAGAPFRKNGNRGLQPDRTGRQETFFDRLSVGRAIRRAQARGRTNHDYGKSPQVSGDLPAIREPSEIAHVGQKDHRCQDADADLVEKRGGLGAVALLAGERRDGRATPRRCRARPFRRSCCRASSARRASSKAPGHGTRSRDRSRRRGARTRAARLLRLRMEITDHLETAGFVIGEALLARGGSLMSDPQHHASIRQVAPDYDIIARGRPSFGTKKRETYATKLYFPITWSRWRQRAFF